MNEVNEKIRKAKGLITQFAAIVNELRLEKDAQVKLYNFIMHQLPGTTLVERKFKNADCSIQGVTDLYSDDESLILSVPSREKRTITFSFFANRPEAIVYSGHYCGRELYKGSWPGAVKFVLDKIKESTAFRALSPEQKNSLRGMVKVLGGKSGGG